MKEIKKILVQDVGWIYAIYGKFEYVEYNGQMAQQPWLKQITKEGVKEYNFSYIIEIDYYTDDELKGVSDEN
jgi:hypothetical protein